VGAVPAWQDFRAALDDDFNTPDALAVMQGVARELNTVKATSTADGAVLAATLRAMGSLLGLLQQDPDAYLKKAVQQGLSDVEIESRLAARRAARADKNFAESDRIRQQLTAAGVILEDKAGGVTEWRRA
jgi:cysteinyl-tRNA synthetase